jgi:hypothetical protein
MDAKKIIYQPNAKHDVHTKRRNKEMKLVLICYLYHIKHLDFFCDVFEVHFIFMNVLPKKEDEYYAYISKNIIFLTSKK